jgi:hypothetical protein
VARVSVKVHETSQYTMVAMCDEELLGREFSQGKIKVRLTHEFFGGLLLDVDSPELERVLSRADSITAFGRTCVEKLVKIFPTVREASVEVAGIPHVQIFKMPFESM